MVKHPSIASLDPAAFAALRLSVQDDYRQCRIAVDEDGWILSATEISMRSRLDGDDADLSPTRISTLR